jgi:hypothetical protein
MGLVERLRAYVADSSVSPRAVELCLEAASVMSGVLEAMMEAREYVSTVPCEYDSDVDERDAMLAKIDAAIAKLKGE